MGDTLPSIDDCDGNDLVLGPVGDDTLFGGGDWPEEEEPDTETIIIDGRLWRIVDRSRDLSAVDGSVFRFIKIKAV